MYEVMNGGYEGQRFERTEPVMTRNADDRYVEVRDSSRHVNAFLPHVQVSICRQCNTGWMSRLEIDIQDILDGMIRGEQIMLGAEEQTLLAAWASKCAFTYACEWAPKNRPWSADEYRSLMATRKPPTRALIWMGHSTALMAHISEVVSPFWTTPPGREGEPQEDLPPLMASTYLAVHSVVFIGHWLPENMPAFTRWEQDLFTEKHREGLLRIWPPTRDISWPTPNIPERRLVSQALYLQSLHDLVAIPFTGRTRSEFAAAAAEFRAGADPRDLRAKWSS
jgi:hypothetical protein